MTQNPVTCGHHERLVLQLPPAASTSASSAAAAAGGGAAVVMVVAAAVVVPLLGPGQGFRGIVVLVVVIVPLGSRSVHVFSQEKVQVKSRPSVELGFRSILSSAIPIRSFVCSFVQIQSPGKDAVFLGNDISQLSLTDALKLVEYLEDKLNITVAAFGPVVITAVEVPVIFGEKTEFDVVFERYGWTDKARRGKSSPEFGNSSKSDNTVPNRATKSTSSIASPRSINEVSWLNYSKNE
ncbi:hypothetical protein RJ640_003647 [Escallonia rubra]|uniref:Large ribosomal subunit protein bL12 oligomerization domain-containing protein n=1 Tax=Escallonia rubra TaxID=112253 RepID=A0AA88UQW5_9ASTE|nr:hypothetical protein RJ640_003647 [Escallonia rubra]